jgi:hypothetical protein
LTKTSVEELVSLATRLEATLMKATLVLSGENTALNEVLLVCPPAASVDTSVVSPVAMFLM